MTKLEPVDLKDSQIHPGPCSVWTSKRFAIGLMAIFIVVVMIAWFGFLGWGVIELMRQLTSFIKSLWTTVS